MLTMLKKDFWYDLPKELIAQEPVSPRDAARLMVLSQKDDSIQHRIFRDLPESVSYTHLTLPTKA